MLPSSRFICLAALATALLGGTAYAQKTVFSQPYDAAPQTGKSEKSSSNISHGGEHFRARGHRSLPPGYQETPSTDFQHGPDPDHDARIDRDSVTGANLSKFGTAYGSSGNTHSGQVGDATGNGWVAPRGNGW